MNPRQDSWIRRLDQTGWPLTLVRLVLAGTFIYMAVLKIQDPVGFLKGVRLYRMLPEEPAWILNSIAISLPWIELLTGLAILFGVWLRGAAVVQMAMLAVFTPAILLRALDVRATEGTPFLQIAFDCGCGTGVQIVWRKLLANSGLFLCSFLAAASSSRRLCLDRLFDRLRARHRYCRSCGYSVGRLSHAACADPVRPGTLPAAMPAR